MQYTRPAAGKIARFMLELLRNLEEDDGIFQELTQTLVQTKLLLPTSNLEVEPDLAALVQTPQLMQGEPHVTLPRVVVVAWMLAVEPGVSKDSGWCPIEQLTQFLDHSTPVEIATRMRAVDTIISRARYVMEDFIQNTRPRELSPVEIKPKVIMRHRNYIRHATTPTTKSSVYHSDYQRPTQTELQVFTEPDSVEKLLMTEKTDVVITFSSATSNNVCLYLFCSIVCMTL